MSESRQVRSGYQSIQDYINPLIDSISQKLLLIAFYAVQGVVTASLITLISLFTYFLLYHTYVPKPISRETIYFNFNHDPPIASVSLLHGEKLGSHTYHPYPHTSTPPSPPPPPKPFDLSRLLKPNYKYSFDFTVELAKSHRNYEIGKFVLSANFLDTTGGVRSHAYHPIIMPYESSVYVFLESLAFFPARLFRFIPTTESITHSFSLVSAYPEPSNIYPPTQTLELTLSTPHIDLLSIHMSILPQLRGMVYYMYYYPYTSLVVGVGILWALQMGVLMGFIAVYLLGRLVLNNIRPQDNTVVNAMEEARRFDFPQNDRMLPSKSEENKDKSHDNKLGIRPEEGDSSSSTNSSAYSPLSSSLNTLRQRRGGTNKTPSLVSSTATSAYNRFSLRELTAEQKDGLGLGLGLGEVEEMKKEDRVTNDRSLLESKDD